VSNIDVSELIVRLVREAKDPLSTTSAADALRGVPAAALADFLHPRFDASADREVLTVGLPASPGAASGKIVVDAHSAVEAADRGEAVILVRTETSPDDVLGMQSARGILTSRGGLASHAAVVARGWGIPAVVGAHEVEVVDAGVWVGEQFLPCGAEISIDGRSGEVLLGSIASTTREAPPELEDLLRWADVVREGLVAVRVNADTAEDAAHARHLGAQGIGLCRTEHMFLAEDRLPLVRRFILTDDPTEETAALADLEAAQEADFEGILSAMDGLPVTVRLLDPPLHEFLPDFERLLVGEATGTLTEAMHDELAAVRRLREVNPMIGTRGVRLGVVKPGVYQMQVRALCRAVGTLLGKGRAPHVEIMIPLVVADTELAMARKWVTDALAQVGLAEMADGTVSIGAMVETPRAALVAAKLCEQADFFSFGTNDLTQLTFAFSRDDVEVRLLPVYLAEGILPANPFEVLDQDGVGRLVKMTCDEARAVKPGMKIGICGEQAGDPASASFLVEAGVDYVSCSPYRVPIARLAVAQALIETGRFDGTELTVKPSPTGVETLAAPSTAAVPAPAPAQNASLPAEPTSDVEAEFAVLHALRIKGFGQPSVLSELSLVSEVRLVAILASLAERTLVRHIPARDLWQLTPDGREHHARQLPDMVGESADGLREYYDHFLDLNTRLKELCTVWQTRNGEPNDHTDAEYDANCIMDLNELARDTEPVLSGFASAVPRFAAYQHRLNSAAVRTAAGETKMFTGVMCGSFHDIWMELHEDLVQLLGVDRHAEGSY
jgi:phosphoenolpyruvate-protein kinase (PTS system EI component)